MDSSRPPIAAPLSSTNEVAPILKDTQTSMNNITTTTSSSSLTSDNTTPPTSIVDNPDSIEEKEQIFMAAQALGQLRNSSTTPPQTSNTIATTTTAVSNSTTDSTLLDKVVAHPLISQSINYMLEKTIQSASTNIKDNINDNDNTTENSIKIPPISNSNTNSNTMSPTTLPPLNMIMNQIQQTNDLTTRTILPTPIIHNNHSRTSSISSVQSRKRFNETSSGNNSHVDESTDDEEEDEKFKRPRLSASSSTNSIMSMSNSPPTTLGHITSTYPRLPPYSHHNPIQRLNSSQYLRQQSVLSQRSLHDIKEIGIINLNIESRKRLNMLINFLKIGNRQISDRIEHLIRLIELQKEHEEQEQQQKQQEHQEFYDASEDLSHTQPLTAVNSNTSSQNEKSYEHSSSSMTSSKTATPDITTGDESDSEKPLPMISDNTPRTSNSSSIGVMGGEIPIQQIKDDIIGTVKKIVNVVSKVSANSLPEPARSNVREALLKLPSNWAFALAGEEFLDSNGSSKKDDENMVKEETETNEDDKNKKNHSLAQKLLANLFRYNRYIRDTYYNRTQSSSTTSSSAVTTASSSSTSSSSSIGTPLSYFFSNESDSSDSNTTSRSWLTKTIESQLNYDMNKNGRILVLAQESLDMINKVIKFTNDSLEKADNWNQNKTNQQQVNLMNKLENLNYTPTTPTMLSTSTTTNDDSTMESESIDSNSTLQ